MRCRTAAVSATVRVTAPAMSAARFSGTTPARPTRPIVDRRPTRAWGPAGPRVEAVVRWRGGGRGNGRPVLARQADRGEFRGGGGSRAAARSGGDARRVVRVAR